MMIELLKKEIETAVRKLFGKSVKKIGKMEVFETKDHSFGDYSSNIAMILAKELRQEPLIIAKEISSFLNKEKIKNVNCVKVAGVGYINFYLKKEYFKNKILEIIKNEKNWGKINILKNQKIVFEHSSPNLFKPFHIGHLVNNAIGESLVRILRNSGANVKTISFPSDISPGIAKTIWAIEKKNWSEKIDLKNREYTIKIIGDAYVYGTEKYKNNKKAKKEIDELNKNLYLGKNSGSSEIYEIGKKISLEYFKYITKRLGSSFDELIFESEAEKVGKEIVNNNIGKIFIKSKSAIIFPGSKYGLFDNVFINSFGFGTYLAKDIGLIKIKAQKFDFDKSITITDVEQKEHFLLVKKVADLINKEWSDKNEFIQHGRLRFSSGKISSRYGNVPLAEDLIDIVKKNVFKKILKQKEVVRDSEYVAEKIAIGSLKYSILKSNAGKNMIFDFKKSISFDGDTGAYLQYTFVRANSILKKVKKNEKDALNIRVGEVPKMEKTVLKFPAVVKKAAQNKSPHYLANYLHKLASEFNSFYANEKILNPQNDDYLNNITLTKAIAITLKKGLFLLGIDIVERM